MKKYIFFIDIDETLIYHSSYLPEININAIKTARENGHIVFLNTGRAPAYIPDIVLNNIEFDGIIAASGSYFSIGDKEYLKDVIPLEKIEKNVRFALNTKRPTYFQGTNYNLAVNSGPYRNGAYHKVVTDVSEIKEKYSDIKVEKIVMKGRISPAEKMYYSSLYQLIQQDTYAECWLRGNDKGLVITKVMKFFEGYTSVGIGDSPNDLNMLETAEISVAMGNAVQKVKDLCDYVTDNAEEGGVGRIIYSIINKTEKQ
ncbi:MAG: HAD family phosphatase [Clostridia bacterium]|nr:HAD family phosphatase [Clostridia bacterium]